MRIGIIGNTSLTQKGIDTILDMGFSIPYVFCIPEFSNYKANYKDLSSSSYSVINSGCFLDIENIPVDLIVSLGDSRIIPKFILDKHKVIGNHGALLPYIQGGASLFWGRILNSGRWGVSLQETGEKLDQGKILRTVSFEYDTNMSMEDFVDLCDNYTVGLLELYLLGGSDDVIYPSSKVDVRVCKEVDSYKVVLALAI